MIEVHRFETHFLLFCFLTCLLLLLLSRDYRWKWGPYPTILWANPAGKEFPFFQIYIFACIIDFFMSIVLLVGISNGSYKMLISHMVYTWFAMGFQFAMAIAMTCFMYNTMLKLFLFMLAYQLLPLSKGLINCAVQCSNTKVYKLSDFYIKL